MHLLANAISCIHVNQHCIGLLVRGIANCCWLLTLYHYRFCRSFVVGIAEHSDFDTPTAFRTCPMSHFYLYQLFVLCTTGLLCIVDSWSSVRMNTIDEEMHKQCRPEWLSFWLEIHLSTYGLMFDLTLLQSQCRYLLYIVEGCSLCCFFVDTPISVSKCCISTHVLYPSKCQTYKP